MKALTIKEPWASLIINGYKNYEFRSWKTNYRGKVLIHAGLSNDLDMIKLIDKYNIKLNNGYILGEVEIIDCIKVNSKFNDELKLIDNSIYRKDYIGCYAWKLDNVKKYNDLILVKGKLGLWNYDKE